MVWTAKYLTLIIQNRPCVFAFLQYLWLFKYPWTLAAPASKSCSHTANGCFFHTLHSQNCTLHTHFISLSSPVFLLPLVPFPTDPQWTRHQINASSSWRLLPFYPSPQLHSLLVRSGAIPWLPNLEMTSLLAKALYIFSNAPMHENQTCSNVVNPPINAPCSVRWSKKVKNKDASAVPWRMPSPDVRGKLSMRTFQDSRAWHCSSGLLDANPFSATRRSASTKGLFLRRYCKVDHHYTLCSMANAYFDRHNDSTLCHPLVPSKMCKAQWKEAFQNFTRQTA